MVRACQTIQAGGVPNFDGMTHESKVQVSQWRADNTDYAPAPEQTAMGQVQQAPPPAAAPAPEYTAAANTHAQAIAADKLTSVPVPTPVLGVSKATVRGSVGDLTVELELITDPTKDVSDQIQAALDLVRP